MAYMVRMMRGKVIVSILDEAGKVERSLAFEPDYAINFAEALTEAAATARDYLREEAAYLADCNSD